MVLQLAFGRCGLQLVYDVQLRFQLGLFDPIEDQPYWHVPPTAVNTPESQALNKLATRQSIILLKNEPVTLPFPKGKVRVICHSIREQLLEGL